MRSVTSADTLAPCVIRPSATVLVQTDELHCMCVLNSFHHLLACIIPSVILTQSPNNHRLMLFVCSLCDSKQILSYPTLPVWYKTKFGGQNFGYQIWFCTRLLIVVLILCHNVTDITLFTTMFVSFLQVVIMNFELNVLLCLILVSCCCIFYIPWASIH